MEDEFPSVSVIIPTHNRKEKLLRLLNSVLRSNYPKDKLEIIVIDDCSTDGTFKEVIRRFPSVIIKKNKKEIYLAAMRNLGIKISNGQFIMFIDDDNVVDSNAIIELTRAMVNNRKIGVAGPLMYYYKDPKRIWCAGIKRSYITSRTISLGLGTLDKGQYKDLIESEDFPNAFMVRREIFEKIGLFDEENYPFHYLEADFCQKVKRAGYKIVTVPTAKIYHDIPVKPLGIHRFDIKRAYYWGRNRITFHCRYSKRIQFILFIFFFEPFLIIPSYLFLFIFSKETIGKKLNIISAFIKGIRDGLISCISWRFK